MRASGTTMGGPQGRSPARGQRREKAVREYSLCVGGTWRAGRAGSAPAISPSSGQTFASVAVADRADVDDAVAAASAAAPAWAALSPFERAAVCDTVAAAILRRADDLARTLAEDQGKPLEAEARDEVTELAEYFTMAAEDAKRLAGAAPPSTDPARAEPAGAARRGRCDQPVELAVHDGRRTVRPRAGRGQRGDLGARADHLGLLRAAGRDHDGRGPARRGVQLPARPRSRGR